MSFNQLQLTRFGQSVDISSDGSTAIVGHPGYKVLDTQANELLPSVGQIHIYDTDALDSSNVQVYGWAELDNLDGTQNTRHTQGIGTSVAVSADGERVIVGCAVGSYDGTTLYPACCRVITKDTTWNENNDIESWTETPNDVSHFAAKVAISDDGTRYAVLSPNHQVDVAGWAEGTSLENNPYIISGEVYVYNHPIGGTRTQVGNAITGFEYNEPANNHTTTGITRYNDTKCIAISGDGTTIAIGKPRDDGGEEFFGSVGRVSVYTYEASSDSWRPKGAPIYGNASGNSALDNIDTIGRDVALNTDGTVLAVVSDKKVKRYEFSSSGSWLEVHTSIEAFTDYTPSNKDLRSVDISGDGNIIIAGAESEEHTNQSAGVVKVFKYANGFLSPIDLGDITVASQSWYLYGARSGDYALRGISGSSKLLGSGCAISSGGTKGIVGAKNGSTFASGATVSNRDYTGLATFLDINATSVSSWSGTGVESDPFVIDTLPTKSNTTDPNENMVELNTTSGGYVSITTGSWSFGDITIQNDEQGWATFIYSDTYHNDGVLESAGPTISPSASPYTTFVYVPPGKVLRIDKLNATGATYSAAQANDVEIFISPTQISVSVDLLAEDGSPLLTESGDNLTHSGTIAIAPAIIIKSQPQDQTTSTPGAQFSVTAEATNGAAVNYQWQVSTDSGVTFSDIAGSTGRVLTLSGSNYDTNGNKYRVVVNAPGAVQQISSYATLTYNQPAVEFTQHPVSQQTITGEVTFSSEAKLSDGTTGNYQWQQSTDSGATWSDITDATGANLVLTGLVASDNATKYRSSFVPETAGVSRFYSDVASVSVITYTVTTQPQDRTASSGYADFRVVVEASDNTRPILTWQKSTDGGITFSKYPEDSTPTPNTVGVLILTSVTYEDNDTQYRVAVTRNGFDGVGAYSNIATLTVERPFISILSESSSTNAASSGQATLRVNAVHSTNAPLSYQWQVEEYDSSASDWSGAILDIEPTIISPARSNLLTGEPVPGVTNDPTSAVLELNNLYRYLLPGYPNPDANPASAAGVWHNGVNASNFRFRCVVSGGDYADSVNTGWMQITVPTPVLTIDAATPADFEPTTADVAIFEVTATATENFTQHLNYQWQESRDGGSTWSDYGAQYVHGTANGAQRFVKFGLAETEDQYQYRCKVFSTPIVAEQISRAATLTVPYQLASSTNPVDVTVASGSQATFSVDASASTPSYAQKAYLWEQSTDGGTTWANAEGNRLNAAYVISSASYANTGRQYRCTVTVGTDVVTTAAATLTVTAPTVSFVTNLSTSRSAHSHSVLAFNVLATSSDSNAGYPDYEWQRKLSGETTWTTLNPPAQNRRTTDIGYGFGNDGTKVRVLVSIFGGTQVASNECLINVQNSFATFHAGYPGLTPSRDAWSPASTQASGSTVTFSARAVIADSGINANNVTTPNYVWYRNEYGTSTWEVVTNDAAQGASYSNEAVTPPGGGSTVYASVLSLTNVQASDNGDRYKCHATVDVVQSSGSGTITDTAMSQVATLSVPVGISAISSSAWTGLGTAFYARSWGEVNTSTGLTNGKIGPLDIIHSYKKIVMSHNGISGQSHGYGSDGFFGIGTDGMIYGWGTLAGATAADAQAGRTWYGFPSSSGALYNRSSVQNGCVLPAYRQWLQDNRSAYIDRQAGLNTTVPTASSVRQLNCTPELIARWNNIAWVQDETNPGSDMAPLNSSTDTAIETFYRHPVNAKYIVTPTPMTRSDDELQTGSGTMGSSYNKFIDISFSSGANYSGRGNKFTALGTLAGVTSDGKLFIRGGSGRQGQFLVRPRNHLGRLDVYGSRSIYQVSDSISGWSQIIHPLAGFGRTWKKVFVKPTHCHAIDDQGSLYGWGSRLRCGDPTYDPTTNLHDGSIGEAQTDVVKIASNITDVSGNLALDANGRVFYISAYNDVHHGMRSGSADVANRPPMQRIIMNYYPVFGNTVMTPAETSNAHGADLTLSGDTTYPVYLSGVTKIYGESPSTCFVIKNGQIYSWSMGSHGGLQLPGDWGQNYGGDDTGDSNEHNYGTIGRMLDPRTNAEAKTIKPVMGTNLAGLSAVDLVANRYSVLAIYRNSNNQKQLFQWGSNYRGGLCGVTSRSAKIGVPTRIPTSAYVGSQSQIDASANSLLTNGKGFLVIAPR